MQNMPATRIARRGDDYDDDGDDSHGDDRDGDHGALQIK